MVNKIIVFCRLNSLTCALMSADKLEAVSLVENGKRRSLLVHECWGHVS